MSRSQNTRLNVAAGLASVTVASVLVLVKLWALSETAALSVGASLADSGLDLMISIAGLAAISYAALPPDEDHAYGHSSAEDLAALGQSVFIFASGGAIIYVSISRLLRDEPTALASEGVGIVTMALSIVLTLGLVAFQRSVARRTGNKVVAADSLHYVGDLIPSVGAIISLVAAWRFDLFFIDSIVALGAGALLIAGGAKIGKGALDALMDRQAPSDLIDGVAAIAGSYPGVKGFHDLKTRMAGSRVFVAIHIELDGEQTLEQAHDIGAGLRRTLIEAYPQADVIIHKDIWRSN